MSFKAISFFLNHILINFCLCAERKILEKYKKNRDDNGTMNVHEYKMKYRIRTF